MARITDIAAEGSSFEIDLEKLVGQRIVRVCGYLSRDLGDPLFKLTRIHFEGGEALWVEGEHDCPYLTGEVGNHKPDVLEALYDEKEG